MSPQLPTAQEAHDEPLSLQTAQEAYNLAVQQENVQAELRDITAIIRRESQRGNTHLHLQTIPFWLSDTVRAILGLHGYTIHEGYPTVLSWADPKPMRA